MIIKVKRREWQILFRISFSGNVEKLFDPPLNKVAQTTKKNALETLKEMH